MEYACEIIGLVKRFGPKTAVDGLSLRVPVGMLYGFLGVNGAGHHEPGRRSGPPATRVVAHRFPGALVARH